MVEISNLGKGILVLQIWAQSLLRCRGPQLMHLASVALPSAQAGQQPGHFDGK